MADKNWRSNERIQECRSIAKATGACQVLVIRIGIDGHVDGASYGVTGALCQRAGKLLDLLCDVAETKVAL